MKEMTATAAKQLYGIDNWGAGYFDVSPGGDLLVHPTTEKDRSVCLRSVVDGLVAEGCSLPVLLRFPEILATQVGRLSAAFENAIEEFDYDAGYYPLYPIKVNQQRPVVEAILRAGAGTRMGLEVGSKTELLVALALPVPDDAYISCSGFKDSDYLRSALHGAAVGKNVVIVIERIAELRELISQIRATGLEPMVGLRMKLSAPGGGKWEKSAGYLSKFGLSTSDLLDCIALLDEAGLGHLLRLLHFHLGSQVPDIRRIKRAIKEAALVYAKIVAHHPAVDVLNVGGGLGVDYDGSQTASDASVNYTVQEFANDVVYAIKEVCDSEGVVVPRIVTETGRVMTAYHSILIVDTVGAIRLGSTSPARVEEADPELVHELAFIRDNLRDENLLEFYHDAVEHHHELASLFSLGYCGLEAKARGENLFWEICHRVVDLAKTLKHLPEELKELDRRLAEKAICNFSVFQSMPDSWALDMQFPIVPISCLDQSPERRATLVDLTCDSDGEVDRFVDLGGVSSSLPIHDVEENRPYYLAVLLIGAYQEVLGDFHNLFGAVSEAQVSLGEHGRHVVVSSKNAQSAREVLRRFGYDPAALEAAVAESAENAVANGRVDHGTAGTIVKGFADQLEDSSYLNPPPPRGRG